jgi:uncharacterized protein YwqG
VRRRRLVRHADAGVRTRAQNYLEWLDKPKVHAAPAPTQPPPAYALWQCDHPPAPGLGRDEIAKRLRASLPEACEQLTQLALPAIGLWPQRRADIPAAASRFGGMPLAPPDWQWPMFEEQGEPLLFVGQINCAELRGLPGAELLPPAGLLAFFAGYDALHGCEPFGPIAVFYWPEPAHLVPARSPIELLEVFPPCALALRPIVDLPHPFSKAVSKLELRGEQHKAYREVWRGIHDCGIPPDSARSASFSKLLGWPDLVQNDLWAFEGGNDARLPLQVDSYCNGQDWHFWGPGGSLYFDMSERDLRARRFERCEYEGQFT